MTLIRVLAIIAGLAALAGLALAEPPAPLSPEQELATLALHDADLLIELVAAEPDVQSPVAMAWDAQGRLFVAEMSDYPVGPEKGRIRLLEDRDADGRYERSTVFASDVAFPTGVLPFRDGLLVTAAPDILFLQDIDADGVADRREVWFTGFAEGNQQLRVNGLHWGADNWIYGANGRSDGDIRRPDDPSSTATSIRGRDFRFTPDRLQFEPVTGQSQFGSTRDDIGERFCSWNTIPLRHALLPQFVLEYCPQLADLACRDIADPADNTQVFPLAPPPQTFNKEATGSYNALCGLTIFRGDALGEAYEGNAFVGESLRNLVHRRTLTPEGPTFVSNRAVAGAEFLASSDPWFHPVFLATGPDGALYVADFYRRWVEHPQWVADVQSRESIDWREGATHGRLWRIRRKDPPPSEPIASFPATANPLRLVERLTSGNGWQRDTAQRLLVEQQDLAAVEPLSAMALASAGQKSRLHALWTLAGLKALKPELLTAVIHDTDPQVRRQGVRLSRGLVDEEPGLRAAVVQALGDADSAVRFEAAIAIGSSRSEFVDGVGEQLAKFDDGNAWDAAAVQIAIGRSAWRYLERFVDLSTAQQGASKEQCDLLTNLGLLIGRKHNEGELLRCFELLTKQDEPKRQLALLAVITGLGRGLSEAGISTLKLRTEAPGDQKYALASLSKLMEFARATALADDAPLFQRVVGAQALMTSGTADEIAPLAALLAAGNPPPLSAAASDALISSADEKIAAQLFADWNLYTTETRRRLIAAAARSPVVVRAMFEAVEADTIGAADVDLVTRETLQALPDAALAAKARQLFAASAPADRSQVLEGYAGSLSLAGDRQRGGVLVAKHCLVCHQIQKRGTTIGPDLSGIGSHPREQLLISLLDPSRQVSPDFRTYNLVTTDGLVRSGLIVNETSATVTVRRAEVTDEVVPRERIELLRASEKSLMPDGFEQKLSQQDVADVLQFLGQPDAALLVSPQ